MDHVEWEEEKKELGIELQKRLMGEKNQIAYDELLKKELPGFLKNYLRSQAKRIYDSENPIKVFEKLRYNFSKNERIRLILDQLEEAIIETTIFTHHEIEEAIKKTVGLQTDLFIGPRQTLMHVFFKIKQKHSLNEIIQAIINISDKHQYINHLIKRLKSVPDQTISKEFFLQISQQAENEIYHKKNIAALVRDISAMADYIGQIIAKPCHEIKKRLVVTMLQQRNLNTLAQRFKKEEIDIQPDLSPYININEIEEKLEKYLKSEETDKFKVASISSSPKKVLDEEHVSNEIIHDIESPENSKIMQEMPDPTEQFVKNESLSDKLDSHQQSSTLITKDETPEAESQIKEKVKIIVNETIKSRFKDRDRNKTVDRDRDTDNDNDTNDDSNSTNDDKPSEDDSMDSEITRSILESQSEGSMPMLKTLIDPKIKKMLIKKIFRRDDRAYHSFINKLELIETWKEAKPLIDGELRKRGIEPFSKEAIRLGDLVYGRYFSKK